MKSGALSELLEELKLFFMRFVRNGFKVPVLWKTGILRNGYRLALLMEDIDRRQTCSFRNDFALVCPQTLPSTVAGL